MKCSDLIKYFEVTGMGYFKHSISMESFLAFLCLVLFWCEIIFLTFHSDFARNSLNLDSSWLQGNATGNEQKPDSGMLLKKACYSYAIANFDSPYSPLCEARLVVLPWLIGPAVFNRGKIKKKKEVYSEFTSFLMHRKKTLFLKHDTLIFARA